MVLSEMLEVHPVGRLVAATSVSVAAFVLKKPEELLFCYALVAAGMLKAGILRQHLRFILIVSLPLLAALLLIWGVIVAPPPSYGMNGVSYATAAWLRIVVLGGAFQWLLLPLAERPMHFRAFLATLRVPATLGTLVVTPILFLPEVQRRIGRIVDARKAQGLSTSWFSGLRAMPGMLMPLVASLLESSIARAELWTHRGLLERDRAMPPGVVYAIAPTAGVVAGAAVLLIAAVKQWI